MKKSSVKRLLCAVLALITLVTAVPFLALEVGAAEANSFSVTYNFNSGTAGNALAKADLTNATAGATGVSVSRMLYAKDPDGGTNVVVTNNATPASDRIDYCGEFKFKDDNTILAGMDFSIEARFYVKDAYPLKGKESGLPLSLIAVINGSSAIPLIRLRGDGQLELRDKDSNYVVPDGVPVMPLNKWTTIKVSVDNETDRLHLWVDGKYINYLQMAALSSVKEIRILQNHGRYSIFVDDLSVNAGNEVDAILDFDSFANGTSLSADALTATLSSGASVTGTSGNIKAVVDPENANNIVSHNSSGAYYMKMATPDLYGRDYVLSGNFRFESFPSNKSGDATVSFFAWVINNNSYYIFCGVDSAGNLLSRSSDRSYEKTGIVLNKNQWYNVTVHYDGKSGKFDVYLDGAYACSGNWGPPKSTPSSQYVRILNDYNNTAFSVYVDDLQVYEAWNTAEGDRIPADGIIYNIDFEKGFAGARPTKVELEDISPYGTISAFSTWTGKTGSTYYSSFVTENGNTYLKTSGANNNHQLDLVIGNGGYDPLKNGTVRLAYDITVEEFPSETALLKLARWRKSNMTGVADAANLLDLEQTGELLFLGKKTGFVLSKDVKYNIEVIINNQILKNSQYTDISVNVSYEVEENGEKKTVTKEIINSFANVDATYTYNKSEFTAKLVNDANIAYFTDDAGNKHYMPYTGLVKCFKLDSAGEHVMDKDGQPVFVDRFVQNKTTYNPDMFRLFQGGGASASGFSYCVDNIIVQQIEDKPILETNFEGWERYNSTENSNNSLFTQANSNGRFERIDSKIVTKDGNTYAELGSKDITSQKHLLLFDPNLNYYGKDIIIETNVYLSEKSATPYSQPGSMICTIAKKTSDGKDAYGFLLRADHDGYLYTDEDKVNPVGQLKEGGWTKIGLILTGNGEKWTNLRILINDELVESSPKTFTAAVENCKFRFTNMASTVIGYDDISIRPYVAPPAEPEPLKIGFENGEETDNAILDLSGDWQYGKLDATRVDADGNTVKTAEILGSDDAKYLRINHSRVKSDTLKAYLDAKYSRYISENTYLIETAVRYTANTSYALNVAEVYSANKAKSASLLSVRGGTNELYINLRGMPYDVVNSAGKTVYAPQIDGTGFAEVAILVDGENSTYTLYVNGRLAYYMYNNEALPCVNMPMHFMDTTVEFSEDFIRLLEISSLKYADSILDVDYINVRSMSNGMSTEIKGAQTRVEAGTLGYDVRFISGIDSLYAGKVGYEITAEYTGGGAAQTKTDDISSDVVFSSVKAGEETISAEMLDSEYLSVVSVFDIDSDVTVKFTIKPYVDRGGVKIYGEAYTASFENGKIIK